MRGRGAEVSKTLFYVTYITENDKLFNYNTKGKQDRSSLLSMTVKVMPARLIKWDR